MLHLKKKKLCEWYNFRDFGEEYLDEDIILLDEDVEQKDQDTGLVEEDGQPQGATGQTQDINPSSIKEGEENTKDVIEDCAYTESDAATAAIEDHIDRIDEDLAEQREDIKYIAESCASLAEDRENEGTSQDTHEHTETGDKSDPLFEEWNVLFTRVLLQSLTDQGWWNFTYFIRRNACCS